MVRSETPRCIVLVGLPGAGKSTIGRLLARRLELPFTDVDELIVTQRGCPIPTIFAEEGEAVFRRYEQQATALALAVHGVVALGGGAVADESIRRLIADHLVIWLTVDQEVAITRLAGSSVRPLLAGDLPARWVALAAEREGFYIMVADRRVATSGRGRAAIVAEINEIVKEDHGYR